MGSYRIVLKESATAELRGLPFPFRRQVNQHIAHLKGAPRPEAAECIDGERYRLRVAGFRILYEVDDEAGVVTVYAISS